jgi:hypothetical protein
VDGEPIRLTQTQTRENMIGSVMMMTETKKEQPQTLSGSVPVCSCPAADCLPPG